MIEKSIKQALVLEEFIEATHKKFLPKKYLIAYHLGFQNEISINLVAAETPSQALFLFLVEKGHNISEDLSIAEMIERANDSFCFVSEPYEI